MFQHNTDVRLRSYLCTIQQKCQRCEMGSINVQQKLNYWLTENNAPIPFSEVYLMRQEIRRCALNNSPTCTSTNDIEACVFNAAKQFMAGVRA